MPIKALDHLAQLSERYDIILSDIWGVVHDGVRVYPAARAALTEARAEGKTVILITNSPRRSKEVIEQIAALGLPAEAYDGIVTSGDVTRALIEQGPRQIFHIGPERDLDLFTELNVELTEEREARSIVCTGLFHETEEQPEDYQPLLQRLRGRDLPFICANPDIIVHIGGRQIWCAGALARIYTQLGGRTLVAGKPHSPIYEQALTLAARARGLAGGEHIDKSRVLAIGDGILTDIKGAHNAGIDALFIAGGIHIEDYSANGHIDAVKLEHFMAQHGFAPVGFMTELA